MTLIKEANAIIKSKKTKEEKIKLLCDLVRDVPYKRIGSLNPSDMIKKGKGSCTPKHVFLARQFKKLRVPVKFLIVLFYYKKLKVKYPHSKKDLVNKMPISYHIALKAKIKNKWTIIDVAWDPELKGFPVNKRWNGMSDMKLAVIPEKIIEKDIDPRYFEKNVGKGYSREELDIRKRFYSFFDEFLIQSRK